MPLPVIDMLRKAIQEKRAVSIRLKGEPSFRLCHPHGLCILSTSSRVVVCWQLSGHSGSGTLPGFRHLGFDKCEEIILLEERFTSHPEFDPTQKMYRKWLLKIE